ncbi:MAG: hypothetical protein ACTSU5_12755 [Promethearchaeota archaeon]
MKRENLGGSDPEILGGGLFLLTFSIIVITLTVLTYPAEAHLVVLAFTIGNIGYWIESAVEIKVREKKRKK